MTGNEVINQLSALLDQFRVRHLERLVVKSAGRISFVNVEEIDWIEAADTYVRLHVGEASHLMRGSLSGLEATLNPTKFIRVHRSTILNINSIKEFQPLFHGEYAITLRDGTKLTSGRSYRNKLHALIANPF